MAKPNWVISSIYDSKDEKRELRCPKCGCEKIVGIETGLDPEDFVLMDLGKKVSCFECGHRFTITENCWEACDESH